MAMMNPAHRADDGGEFAGPRLRLKGSLISVVALAMGLAGCAREPAHREFNLTQREVKAKREVRVTHVRLPLHTRVHAETRQPAELRVHRVDPALLAPQPAPNCEFKRSDVKAVDPNEWARLKTEYERQCYQDAEKAARDRLAQLQASNLCEVERVSQHRPAR
jgi:hypothetical protein